MDRLKAFTEVYKNLTRSNLHTLELVYSRDIRFADPAHEIIGLAALQNYFAKLYEHTSSIHFDFTHSHQAGGEAYLQWKMTFSHPRLGGGARITVPGASFLEFDDSGRVRYHRDYFDLGLMLYEQLPLLGAIIKKIKRKLGQ